MKNVIVKKNSMKVVDIVDGELQLYGMGGSIKRMFYIFEEDDSTVVSVGDTCTIINETTRSYA